MDGMIGRELGPYRIVEQIGVGGMATVYKAYHAVMNRYVAVKVMPEQMSQDEDFRRRFEREAKAVARLEHAHILPVHDYGEMEGRLYLVMRYIDAGTLKDRMAAGPLDLAEVNRVIRQVGRALEYAHGMGVVHRDVKPSNVLVDAQGDCYLCDFGLAKMLEASVQFTATGVGVGTPAYMSPEQGQGEKVDARSDIYSLGVMLYEMVTGQVPYEAETPLAVVLKHITAPLPLPRKVKPDVPEEVERVILRALAKNPDDRFQAMEEMMAALDVAVSGAAVEEVEATRIAVAPPPVMPSPEVERVPAPPPAEPAPVPVRPGLPWKWVAGIGAAVVVIVGLVIALARERGPSTPTPEPPMATPVAQATTPAPTVAPTATPIPPTDTPVPPTPVPPTDTDTPTATSAPTNTPIATPTAVPVPPTNTPTPQIIFLRPGCGTTYTVQADRPLEIRYGSWIAIGADLAEQNAQHLTVRLVLDGEPVTGVQQPVVPISAIPCTPPLADAYGVFYVTQVGPLGAGTHVASGTWILDEQVTDGYDANGDGAPELYGPGEVSTHEFTIIAQ